MDTRHPTWRQMLDLKGILETSISIKSQQNSLQDVRGQSESQSRTSEQWGQTLNFVKIRNKWIVPPQKLLNHLVHSERREWKLGFTAQHRYISQADSLLLCYWTQECEKDKPQRNYDLAEDASSGLHLLFQRVSSWQLSSCLSSTESLPIRVSSSISSISGQFAGERFHIDRAKTSCIRGSH